MLQSEGGKRQNVCTAEDARVSVRGVVDVISISNPCIDVLKKFSYPFQSSKCVRWHDKNFFYLFQSSLHVQWYYVY